MCCKNYPLRSVVYFYNVLNATVNNFTLSNMWVGLNGGWSVRLSGYNNTVKNVSVFGNGCGGISVEGGDRVRLYIGLQYI